MRTYHLTFNTCLPGVAVPRSAPPQLVFHRTPTTIGATIRVDPAILCEQGRVLAASVHQEAVDEFLLVPEQPFDDGWLLLIDASADADTFGFVDLVVRQADMWGALSPGRYLTPHFKGGQRIWTADSDWADLLHGPFVPLPAVRVLAHVGFEEDPERMVVQYQALIAIVPHPTVWGVMITQKGVATERSTYWQLPQTSGETLRHVSSDEWQAIADADAAS